MKTFYLVAHLKESSKSTIVYCSGKELWARMDSMMNVLNEMTRVFVCKCNCWIPCQISKAHKNEVR